MRFRSGFTLIELLIVMTIIILLMAAALRGMINSQRTFVFNATIQTVSGMVREARSLAVTGKAQPDYTDYDNDGCFIGDALFPHTSPECDLGPDYVTPANYGVFFDNTLKTATLFADLHGSGTEGVYDVPSPLTGIGQFEAGKDLKLSVYSIPSTYLFILNPGGTRTVMYSPIFADTTFYMQLAAAKFHVFGVKETGVSNPLSRCYAIHPIAGNPETTDATGTSALCI